MSELTQETVEYLADLSRIACTEEQKSALLHDLAGIVRYVEQLNEIDTEGVEPCSFVNEYVTKTPVRDDVPKNTLPQKIFLENAPLATAGMVRVPLVLKQE